ncbi:hypothetical protein NPIL_627371 [Nephila pilipes]|uniref:Uncharacterized protein n=1 Tax=Nephila pilipes TaxID=299642 RepID=A0A8X6N5X7_NEPPI|nr:hypothetical protein NPIL_627371 [Nephila pilipes]
MRARDPCFPGPILFTNESIFTQEGVFNSYNSHVRLEENQHATSTRVAQEWFSVNVWDDILGDHPFRPYNVVRTSDR